MRNFCLDNTLDVMTGGNNLSVVASLVFEERKVLPTVKETALSINSQSECRGLGRREGNAVHEALILGLNSKRYMGGNPNSELGPGDFLDVYQSTPTYR